jgi:hypothetical protein
MLKRLMLVPLVLAVMVLASVGGVWLLRELPKMTPVSVETDSRNTQIVNSINRLEQVVLLGLSIQGISEETSQGQILGWGVPGTTRTAFLQYEFHAKLGLEGGDVQIEQQGEDSFLITIPEFIFIGHDDVSFRVAAADDGVLSWTTPEIDNVETINKLLNDDARQQYIDANEEMLKEQARNFYTGVIASVDPQIDIAFEFSG